MAFVFKRYGIYGINGLPIQLRPVAVHCPVFCSSSTCDANVKRRYQSSRDKDYLVSYSSLYVKQVFG